ncbi:hypothetical protein LEN26_000664 [Aphanomyces euteiches]|nr:hypothetical protein AeMF1_000991 [Aphanomyces euteiches]KAH9163068.1 hypothetical protein LEN26_000664 [Aphanomyces euteiches]KAH9197223.1 hypothetical protein AeNC1_000804 [Aphanomyces euteiches]
MMKPTAMAVVSVLVTLAAASQVTVSFSESKLVQGSMKEVSVEADVASLSHLAMESLALPQLSGVGRPLPIVADLIAHTNAFGFVLLENIDSGVSLQKGQYAFQKTLGLEDASSGQFTQLAHVLAKGIKQKHSQSVVSCSGVVCADMDKTALTSLSDAAAKEAALWSELSDLDKNNKDDAKFVSELANMRSVVESINSQKSGKGFFVSSISTLANLAPTKQTAALVAVSKTVNDFHRSLQAAYGRVGFQLLQLSGPMKIDIKVLSASMAVSRQLTALAANSSNASLPTPLTVESIAEYQVILWSSVILVTIIIFAVSTMTSIDASRDNLLYAKFLTDPNGRKND